MWQPEDTEVYMWFTFMAHIIYSFFSFFFFNFLFICLYFWLHWVFITLFRIPLVAASGGYSSSGVRASHCGAFSCCRAQALGTWASVAAAYKLDSMGSVAVAHKLSHPVACGILPDQ